MTWRELKEAISRIPEDQLWRKVRVWGEDIPVTTVNHVCKESEDIYYLPCDDVCVVESDIDPDELNDMIERGEAIKTLGKNISYLWVG